MEQKTQQKKSKSPEHFYDIASHEVVGLLIKPESEGLKIKQQKVRKRRLSKSSDSKFLWSRRKSMITTMDQEQLRREKIQIFAQKYSYQQLVQKYPKPRSVTNEYLMSIIAHKMSVQQINNDKIRKQIWLLASGAKYNLIQYPNLYRQLLEYQGYPDVFTIAIQKDLYRTVNQSTSSNYKEDAKKLFNILNAFSRRNPYVGYCQGLNFVAFFIIKMGYTQQQSFWLLSGIIENILPLDYYTSMIGVLSLQQIFLSIVKQSKPEIFKKFQELNLQPLVLSISWFVTLFTSSLPQIILWDHLLVEGVYILIKMSIIIIEYNYKRIMESNQFCKQEDNIDEIINILDKDILKIDLLKNQLHQKLKQYKLNLLQYKKIFIKCSQFYNKSVYRNNDNKIDKCKIEWPICINKLNKYYKFHNQFQIWIYRYEAPTKLIHDYLLNENNIKNQILIPIFMGVMKNKLSINQKLSRQIIKKRDQLSIEKYTDIMMGRIHHACIQRNVSSNQWQHRLSQLKFLTIISEKQEEVTESDQTVVKLSQCSSQESNQLEQKSLTVKFYNNFIKTLSCAHALKKI